MERLYNAILTLLENGYNCTPQSVEKAKNLCVEHGSLSALKSLYPWHSSFQHDKKASSNDMFAMDFHFNPNGSVSEGIRTTQNSTTKSSRHGSVSSNMNTLQSTGGMYKDKLFLLLQLSLLLLLLLLLEAQWKVASQQAEAKLESIRVDTLREMDSIVKKAKELSAAENIKYVDAILRIQQVISFRFFSNLILFHFVNLVIFKNIAIDGMQ